MIHRILRWLRRKSVWTPMAWTGSYVDSYHRHREPTALDLLGELKNTAWTCASVNSAVCASYPPKLYLEVHGSAFWLLQTNPMLGIPEQIWILPTQNVRIVREPNSKQLVDYYEYRGGAEPTRYRPDQIIHFRFPNPRDPYTSGLSP